MATQSCTCMYFNDAAKAIEWFNKVAQFETLFRVDDEDGRVRHCELGLGPVTIMIGQPCQERSTQSPATAGGSTGGIYIVMKDDDALNAHYEHAKQQDAASIDKPPFKTDYGSLDYSLKIEGHNLYFGTYEPHTHKAAA